MKPLLSAIVLSAVAACVWLSLSWPLTRVAAETLAQATEGGR